MSQSEDISHEEKLQIISQFGIVVAGKPARIVSQCSHHTREPNDGSPHSSAVPPTAAPETTPADDKETDLQSAHANAKQIGVPLIAVGAFHRGSDKAEAANGSVVFSVDCDDMEACSDYECLTQIYKEFISTSIEPLEKNVKAVLVKLRPRPRQQQAPVEFAAFNFCGVLKQLLEKNFHLEFRDEKSRASREQKRLDKSKNSDATPTLTSAKEAQSDVYQVDPFYPTTPRQVWIEVSLNYDHASGDMGTLSAEELHDQAWHWWSDLQTYTGISPKLGLCLEVGSSFSEDFKLSQRWFSERLRAIRIPLNVWRKNKAGFPILPPRLREFITRSFHIPHITYLLTDEGSHHREQFRYLIHLYKDYVKGLRDLFQQKMMRHLADMPIRPLQPLRDNLTQEIYSVFEGDPIKYKLYHDASYLALQDLKAAGRGIARRDPIVAMVVGAGRGPLVTEFIKAAVSLGIFYKIYALDKNPVAISAMMAKLTADWEPYACFIHIVQSDMRKFDAKEKADILISELLGSFGCNELSPECLDGAQSFLKPDGVSIPSSYSNFLQPVMAVTLHQDIETYAPKIRKMVDEFVLVELRSSVEIAPYQEAFTFTHPNFEPHSNERDVELRFRADNDYRMTGFAGYFTLNLYKDVSMNILPDKHTVGLTSWFPAFFALSRPVDVKKGDDIVLHMGRRVNEDARRVWYCWGLQEPTVLPVQNAFPTSWIGM